MLSGLAEVRKLVIYGVLSHSFRMMVGATSVIFLMSRGVSLGELGLLKGFQAGLILALDIPLGYAADRWGRRRVLTIAGAATALWLALSAMAEHSATPVLIFFTAEAFGALGIAAFNGAYSAVLLSTYERTSGKRDFENILGWYGKWQFMLMAIAAFIGAALGGHASTTIWWVAALGTAALTLSAWRLLPADAASVPSESPTLRRDMLQIVKSLLAVEGLIWLAMAYIGLMLGYQVLLQFWQPIVALSPLLDNAGWSYGLAFVMFLLAQSVASEAARNGLSLTRLLSVGAFACGGLALVIGLGADSHVLTITLSLTVVFFAFKFMAIGLLSAVQRALPARLWATTESSLSTLMRLLFIVLLPLVGFSSEQGSAMTIVNAVLVILLGALICIACANRKGKVTYV